MAYTPVGLTGDQITALKNSWRATGWRLKVFKASGNKLPDSATTNITKIDQSGGAFPIDTDGGRYRRMISDSKNNRTFILHNNRNADSASPIVSIINHFLPTDHAEYIETINTATSSGWDTNYTKTIGDFAFDPDQNRIAITVEGTGTNPPAVFVINTVKYADSLLTNECNKLAPNSAYLDCTVWTAGALIHNADDSTFPFIRYYAGKFYVWSESIKENPGLFDPYWQLGYFQNGSYTIIFQYGDGPAYNENNINGVQYSTTVRFPQVPRWRIISDSQSVNRSPDGFIGDPVTNFREVTSFEINDDGILLICSTPDRNRSNGFGIEATASKIDLNSTNAVTEFSFDIEMASTFNGSNWQVLRGGKAQTVTLTDCGGMIYVKAVQAHTGSKSGANLFVSGGNILKVENRYGMADLPGGPPDTGENTQWHGAVFAYGDETVKVGIVTPDNITDAAEFSLKWNITVRQEPFQLLDTVGEHTAGAQIKQASDTTNPATVAYLGFSSGGYVNYGGDALNWNIPQLIQAAGDTHTAITSGVYNSSGSKYIMGIEDEGGVGLGLWVLDASQTARRINKLVDTGDLAYDDVKHVLDIGGEYCGIYCDNSAGTGFLNNITLQFFDDKNETFFTKQFVPTPLQYNAAIAGEMFYDNENKRVGFSTWNISSQNAEIWFWEDVIIQGTWSRNPRIWWDGSDPDLIIGVDGTQVADDMGQLAKFTSPQFSDNKGTGSNQFSFDVQGAEYLPWKNSKFNTDPEFPEIINPTLGDTTRIIIQSGVQDTAHNWTWLDEGYGFILKSPSMARQGIADMTVTCMGIIAFAVTHSTYKGTHQPDITSYTNVAMTSADGLIYNHNPGSGNITDWLVNPQPVIKIDGTITSGTYDLNTTTGTVTFATDRSANTITATFEAFDSGTNEAEDIIICILTYPQELGGAGLDETYITDNILGETLTTTDNLTYSFSKNNIRNPDGYNAIYRDGAPASEGAGPNDFTWNYRNGTVTFNSDQSAVTITGDCTYYTIQKSGATMPTLHFHPRKQKSSYDAIQEVMRRVAPNYILRERRDGKIEADFFTQKAAGSEDLTITDADIIITDLSADPAFEGLATRVVSFGQAELDELPNKCLGATVTDNWTAQTLGTASVSGSTTGWHNNGTGQEVVDGDPATGATTGYGRWGEGTLAIQNLLIAAGDTGVPALTVDMGESLEITTIIIARPSQRVSEGDGGAVQQQSVWASNDGSTFTKLVGAFAIPPGGNTQLEAGTNYEEGTKFRYIRINIHSLGLYKWGQPAHTDSQMGISEIQCYESEIIEGTAELQTDDSAADYYDSGGLLAKYGIRTHIARDGQPDPSLNTQSKADADAGNVLNEIIRLVNGVQITSPWLPAIPKFSTIKVSNGALDKTVTFFVESRTASDAGHTYTGSTLP